MQVKELATDLKITPELLVSLLRKMGIAISDKDAAVSEADVSRVLARIERERRAGHKAASEAVEAAIEEAASGRKRRRRRRRADIEPEPEPEAVEVVEGVDGEIQQTGAVSDQSEPGVDVEASDEADAVDPADAVDADEAADAVDPDEAETESPEADVSASASEGAADVETAEVAAESSPEAEQADPGLEETGAAEVESAGAEEPLPPPPRPKPQPAKAGAPSGPVRVLRRPPPAPAASAGPGGRVRIKAEGYTPDGREQQKEKKKKRQRVDRGAVKDNIQRVMAELKGGGGKKRRRGRGAATREEREAAEEQVREEQERERTTVKVNEFLTVAELAELVDVSSTEIIGAAFKNLGLMVTINQRLDFDQIEMLLDEFNFIAVREEDYGAAPVEDEQEAPERPEDLKPRPPVVTVMGHVDHGKTLLLDSIRDANVVAGEAGGITQHIGAYHVDLGDDRTITFLDTPGHAAFTAMRARGADVTDIVILVVAADDSIMPQTIEAISHAKNAGVPLVIAVNKIDLPAADPLRVRQQLLQHEVNVEEFGGDVLSAEVSAKTGQGIDDLLEKVLLQAELLEIQANPDRDAHGTVIEAQLDVGKGPVLTILVQKGTLRVGDSFVCGLYDGRVRAMLDERGAPVVEAGPGIPVMVLGSPGVPQAGDVFRVMAAAEAAEIAGVRQRLDREKQLRIRERGIKLGDFSKLVTEGKTDHLPLIIKGDVDGSVQAVSDALEQLSTDEVAVRMIHRGVGAINESDVLLAQTGGAIILGFRVRPSTEARLQAEREDVEIKVYDVIYDAVNDVRDALEGMLAPEQRETVLGSARVKEVFKITGVGTIGGSEVISGTVDKSARARVVRDGVVVYASVVSSLKRFKDDVKEVRDGLECGIGIANYNDIKVGDVIESYLVEEIARTLDA